MGKCNERRVGKWDTAISKTLLVKLSVLWYIVHSFDVIKKTKYMQYAQRLYLAFLFVSPITQSFILPILSLFLSVPSKVKSHLYTEAHSGCTKCTLSLDKGLLWPNTRGSPLPRTFKSRNHQVVRIISLPHYHESRAQDHCKSFHPWQWGSFTSKYTVKDPVKSVKRQNVIALFGGCCCLLKYFLLWLNIEALRSTYTCLKDNSFWSDWCTF